MSSSLWKKRNTSASATVPKSIKDMNNLELAAHAGISKQHFLALKLLVENRKISVKGTNEMSKYISEYVDEQKSPRAKNEEEAEAKRDRKSTDSVVFTFGKKSRKSRKKKSNKSKRSKSKKKLF